MKPERIEDLLRHQPPDEPHYGGQLDLAPITTNVVRSGPTRRAGSAVAALRPTALIVMVVAVVLIGALVAVGSAVPSPSPSQSEAPQTSAAVGVIPWIDATPAPSPSPEPTSLAACQSGDLALAAGGWSGATGSLGGGITLLNVSSNPCHVTATPSVELLDASGSLIAAAAGSGAATGLVALSPGGDAGAVLVWENWCLPPPHLPLHIRLTVAAGVAPLSAEVRVSDQGRSEVPRCDNNLVGSGVGLTSPLAVPGPSSGGATSVRCAAANLVAFSGGWSAGAGSEHGGVVVLNVGNLDCTLPATPTLEVRDAHGQLAASTGPASNPTAVVTLPVESTAVATIGFSDWCVAQPPLPLGFYLVIGSTAVRVGSVDPIPVPSCTSQPQMPPHPAFAYDGPFTIPGTPAPPEPDPVDSLPVKVTVSPLPTIAPGAVLNYTVTLTNESPYDKPINLGFLCPSYSERLFLPGSPTGIETTLALNCAAAGWLAGRASETFEMRLPIQSDAPGGTATLVWQLGQRGPSDRVTFMIGP